LPFSDAEAPLAGRRAAYYRRSDDSYVEPFPAAA
jgi:hypothetical protein